MYQQILNTSLPVNTISQHGHQGGLKIKNGDILRGTVVKQGPGQEVILSVRGTQFRANSRLKLVEGNRYYFQVSSQGNKTELKILDGTIYRIGSPSPEGSFRTPAGRELANILREISRGTGIKGLSGKTNQILKNIQEIFSAAHFRGQKEIGPWIHRCILESGMAWENKVLKFLSGDRSRSKRRLINSDLKGLLLALEDSMNAEDPDNKAVKSLAAKMRQALHLIEQIQIQNLSGIMGDSGWLFFIPGHQEEGFRGAELFFRKGDKAKGIFFSLLMDFTRLGEIEFQVSFTNSVINIKVITEDEEKASLVGKNLETLEKGLQGLGLKTGRLTCDSRTIQDRETEQQTNVHLII